MAPRIHSAQPNSFLPNHLWLKIFETGVTGSHFRCEDLSSLSISCKNFDSISKQNSLWSSLLNIEFPSTVVPPHIHSSSMKSVYKSRLGVELHRIEASIFHESAVDEHQLNLLSQRIKMIRHQVTVYNDPVRELAKEIVKVGNRSPAKYLGHFKAIYDPVVLIDEQLKKLSGGLIHMINFREYGAQHTATDCKAPPRYTAQSCVSSTPQLEADIISLENKADFLVTEYQKFINFLLGEQGQIQVLLDRQQQHEKQLAELTTRLLFFGTNDAENDLD